MKFEIVRASDFFHAKEPPCEGAVCEKTDEDCDKEWSIEIATLEDLIALSNRVGHRLVVDQSQIWIYDNYME